MLRTATAAIALTLFILLAGPFLLLHAWITGRPDLLYRVGSQGVILIAWAAGLRTRIEGREKIPPGVVLFMANHTSFVDPVPIAQAIPRRVAFLAKVSLFKLPVVGWAFRLADFVPVDRSDRESAIESVELAAKKIKSGASFLAYPEGTRSYDGRLLPFKRGVFVMAIRSGVPIVPVVAIGVHRLMPKGAWRIKPGEVLVRFGDPIETSRYSLEDRATLAAQVRMAMASLLPPDQQPLDLPPAEKKK
jgi:1-acyl-sn-glycerol-3-phosphate acyltransferase